ncbi:MAG: DnaJ domain-containing protein [Lachnospiraceae bacterium]|jgi:DnaJ-class molecular chaperone|nr:DnaJ domain-containing protein [Lachnospiraceae bacterium]
MAKLTRQEALAVMGLTDPFTEEMLKNSYRNLMKEFHPDTNPDPDNASYIYVVQEAYDILLRPTVIHQGEDVTKAKPYVVNHQVYPHGYGSRPGQTAGNGYGSQSGQTAGNGYYPQYGQVQNNGFQGNLGSNPPTQPRAPRVFGDMSVVAETRRHHKEAAARDRYDEMRQKQKKLEQEALEQEAIRQREERYRQTEEKRKEETYEKAMQAIRAILAARTIKRLIEEETENGLDEP